MSYIAFSDITDNVVKAFGSSALAAYITEADTAVNDIAEKLGVSVSSISTPVHFKVKRYAISYVCMRVCQDYMGTNNIDTPEMEKYAVKYEMYRRECATLEEQITPEMLGGTVDEPRDRAGIMTSTIYRG